MGNYTILIHAGFAVLLVLYLLVRLLFSLFGLRDKDFQNALRRKFRIIDWVFLTILIITGIYPIIALGQFEFYHLIKVALTGGIVYIFRYNQTINLFLANLLVMAMVFVAGYTSFTDTPKFPREPGKFEKDHPEIASLPMLQKGEAIYRIKCAPCHGFDGKLRRFQAADLTRSTLDKAGKIKTINKGVPLSVMRSFTNELSPSEIEAVAQYVEQEFSEK